MAEMAEIAEGIDEEVEALDAEAGNWPATAWLGQAFRSFALASAGMGCGWQGWDDQMILRGSESPDRAEIFRPKVLAIVSRRQDLGTPLKPPSNTDPKEADQMHMFLRSIAARAVTFADRCARRTEVFCLSSLARSWKNSSGQCEGSWGMCLKEKHIAKEEMAGGPSSKLTAPPFPWPSTNWSKPPDFD